MVAGIPLTLKAVGGACLFKTAKKKFFHISQSSFSSEAAAFTSQKEISNRSRRNSSSSNLLKICHIQNSGFSLRFLFNKSSDIHRIMVTGTTCDNTIL